MLYMLLRPRSSMMTFVAHAAHAAGRLQQVGGICICGARCTNAADQAQQAGDILGARFARC
jgi:hypothetical protein